jgi:dihydroorotate dehydrogenase
VGGIHSPEDALEKLAAGASLVQLYTGFIYEGPGLIGRVNKAVLNSL